MKWITGVLSMLFCGLCAADTNSPRQVRVSLQFIEMPHPELTELLGGNESGGGTLHVRALALMKSGKAKIVESCLITGQEGRKLTLEGIREEIYPTEYCPPTLPCSIGNSVGFSFPEPPMNPMYRSPTAFETRNTGMTFEVEALVENDGRTIGLRLDPEWITPVRLETWAEHHDQWGDASVRMPIFEALRVRTSVSVIPGRFMLVSVINPKPLAPGPAVSRKVLLFVRADVMETR